MPILTDKRREVLTGNFEGTESTEATHKSRIRSQSREALQHLIEVAESDEIDNRDVFDPDDVFRLLRALFHPGPEHYTKDSGLIGHEDLDDEYRAYTDRLYVQIDKVIRDYQTREEFE